MTRDREESVDSQLDSVDRGLAEEIGRSAPHGFDDVARLPVTRKHHDRHVGQELFELIEGLESIHSRQDHIEGD